MSDLVSEAIVHAKPTYVAMSRARSMDEAVLQAEGAAHAGDVVLLSPGGTSYDMYRDFEERGHDFRRAVEALQA
jgi:UDP-N-acetylmuramoylalanine--D-glutamate ligase